MQTLCRRFIVLALAAVTVTAAGCSRPLGGSDVPSRFYMLTAQPIELSAQTQSGAQQGPIVGIFQVELADHLKHQEIVTLSTANQVVLAASDSWGASLGNNITTVLSLNLSNMIPTERVAILPSSRSVPLDYRVNVSISTFEKGPDGVVQLIAVWQVFKGDNQQLLAIRKSTITQPVEGDGYDAIVAAMSKALGELSRRITAEIR